MSFIDDIIDVGSSVVNFLGGSGIGSQLARTALTGYALNQITQSINRDNQNQTNATNAPDPGVRLQVNPNPNQKIPVVYGQATLGGIVTDAVLTNNNQTMWYCVTLCEQTGKLNLGGGVDSQIRFKDIYWNNEKIIFANDGITAASSVDITGAVSANIGGQVKIYCFSNGSVNPVVPTIYSNTSLTSAWNIFPNWTSSHTMDGLVFALVRVDYNKEKGITGLGSLEFTLQNTMTQPGDCLYDMMTNTRYGAGIAPTEIYAQ